MFKPNERVDLWIERILWVGCVVGLAYVIVLAILA